MQNAINNQCIKAVADLLTDLPVLSICELACDGECSAISTLHQTNRDACRDKIIAFICENINQEVHMQNSLFELNPQRYCKRAVEVTAIRFIRSNFEEVRAFTNGQAKDLYIERCPNGKCTCIIPTLEGDHLALEGDFIIRGVQGEFYPCKPDIFWKSYELVGAA